MEKHIIVLKPFCLTIKEFKIIKKKFTEKKNLKFLCNLVLRVNSLFKKLSYLLRIRKLFILRVIISGEENINFLDGDQKTKNYSLTLGAGIHVIDLVMWFVGRRPLSVRSFGNNIATKNSKFKKKAL